MAEDKKRGEFELKWEGDYVAKLDELYELSEERKKFLSEFRLPGGDEEDEGDDQSSGSPAGRTPGSNNPEKVWNFLADKGFTAAAVAGVMGNLEQESGIDPNKLQQLGGGKIGRGRGLCQWETPGRWDTLLQWAKKEGKDEWDIQTQLEYMWIEITSKDIDRRMTNQGIDGFEAFKNLTDYKKATEVFEKAFERAGKVMWENRYNAAKKYLDKYGSGDGSKSAPTVKIEDSKGGNLPGGLKAASIVKGKVVIPTSSRSSYHSTVAKGRRADNFKGYVTLSSDKYYSNLSGCTMMVSPEMKPFVDLLYETFRSKGLLTNNKMPVNSVYRVKDPDKPKEYDNGAHGWGSAIDVGCFGVKDALAKADAAWALGFRAVAPGGSLDAGRGFVHIDIGPSAEWNYSPYPTYSGPSSWKSYR